MVQSIFSSLQGEGPFSGRPACFVRLSGCNLCCFWCDTSYSTPMGNFTPEEVLKEILALDGWKGLVVLTGGEPYCQNIQPLVRLLLDRDWEVQLETNGTLFLELPYRHPSLTVVCSPKTSNISSELRPFVKSWKYLVSVGNVDESGLPRGLARPQYCMGEIFLQPLDEPGKIKDNTDEAVRLCLKHGYRLSLQLHKILNIK